MSGRVAIVGGGITGLSAAYALQSRGLEVSLIEASDHLGGKVYTERADGFVIEGGPDAMLTQKPWALELCGQLGLDGELVSPVPDRKTYILFQGGLRELPRGAMGFIPTHFASFLTSDLFSLWGKLRMGLELFVPPRPDGGDESLGAFVRRRLGHEPLERLAEPLLAGVYASDADQLGLQAAFPQLRALERTHGSLIRGALAHRRKRRSQSQNGERERPPLFMTLRPGLGGLVGRLAAKLRGVRVLTGRCVTGIDPGGDGRYRVTLSDGETFEAHAVILATPAYVTAKLVEALSHEAADKLSQISYVSTAVVSLGFKRIDVEHPLDATGFLVPRTERRAMTACTWSSSKWPGRAPRDHALFRCFFGRAGQEDVLCLDDGDLVHLAHEELRDLIGANGTPVLSRRHRWPRSMPQYEVGHLDRLAQIEHALKDHPGVVLAGAAYGGIGLPDCIRQGREAALRVCRTLRLPSSALTR